MIRTIYLLTVLCLYSCLDPFFDRKINVSENLYLIHDMGINGFKLTQNVDQNIYIVLVDQEVNEVYIQGVSVYVKQTDQSLAKFYQFDLSDSIHRNAIIEISESKYRLVVNSTTSKLMFTDGKIEK